MPTQEEFDAEREKYYERNFILSKKIGGWPIAITIGGKTVIWNEITIKELRDSLTLELSQ